MGEESRGPSFNGTIRGSHKGFLFFLKAACRDGLALLLPALERAAHKHIRTSLSFKCGVSYSTLLKKIRDVLHVNAVWESQANTQSSSSKTHK